MDCFGYRCPNRPLRLLSRPLFGVGTRDLIASHYCVMEQQTSRHEQLTLPLEAPSADVEKIRPRLRYSLLLTPPMSLDAPPAPGCMLWPDDCLGEKIEDAGTPAL